MTEPGDREAARYRRKLREVEVERDSLAERVQRYRRLEVARLSDALAQPEDLFTLGGADLDALLDSEGDVDPDAVAGAVSALLAARPGLRAEPPAPSPAGAGIGVSGSPTAPPARTFSDVLRSR